MNGNQVEHYEVALYGTLVSFARSLGLQAIIAPFEETLDEEKKADAKLSQIAEPVMNARAAGQHAGGTSRHAGRYKSMGPLRALSKMLGDEPHGVCGSSGDTSFSSRLYGQHSIAHFS